LSMGGHSFSTASYSAQRSLMHQAASASRSLKLAGNAMGGFGTALTVGDMMVNGVNTSNSIDLAMGVIGFIPGWGWAVSGLYYIGNEATKAYTGKDIGQHIDAYMADN
jgi:hypothetical protein